MSVAEKLLTIAENEPKIFVAGRKVEYDRFWDTLQDYGKRVNNSYLCCNSTWDDTIYDPKYPIKTNTTANNATYMFYRAAITDTKVPITINATNSTGVFYYATSLVTIPKLTVADGIKFTDWFTGCSALKNITFDGTISRDLNMQWCPLTVDSMLSIINHLKNYAGTTSEGVYTLTFSDDCWARLEAWHDEQNSESGWSDYGPSMKYYVQYILGWSI